MAFKVSPRTQLIVCIGFIAVLAVMSIIFFFLGFNAMSNYNRCVNNESPSCMHFVCNNGVTTNTCGSYAYRCVGENKMMCSNNTDLILDSSADPGLCTDDTNICPYPYNSSYYSRT